MAVLAITREDEFHLNYIVCFEIYTNVALPSNSTTANDAPQAATSLEVTSNVFSVWCGLVQTVCTGVGLHLARGMSICRWLLCHQSHSELRTQNSEISFGNIYSFMHCYIIFTSRFYNTISSSPPGSICFLQVKRYRLIACLIHKFYILRLW